MFSTAISVWDHRILLDFLFYEYSINRYVDYCSNIIRHIS